MEDQIRAYTPVSLQEIYTLALLNRMDTKCLLSYTQLAAILSNLYNDCQILTIGERSIHNEGPSIMTRSAFSSIPRM